MTDRRDALARASIVLDTIGLCWLLWGVARGRVDPIVGVFLARLVTDMITDRAKVVSR